MAGFVELTLEQGATFSTQVSVKDANGSSLDLTNFTARSQMRKSYYSSNYSSFTVTIPNPQTGNINMSMSSTNTANLSPGRYVFDLEIESNSNDVTRVIEGIVTVLPNVTR